MVPPEVCRTGTSPEPRKQTQHAAHRNSHASQVLGFVQGVLCVAGGLQQVKRRRGSLDDGRELCDSDEHGATPLVSDAGRVQHIRKAEDISGSESTGQEDIQSPRNIHTGNGAESETRQADRPPWPGADCPVRLQEFLARSDDKQRHIPVRCSSPHLLSRYDRINAEALRGKLRCLRAKFFKTKQAFDRLVKLEW